MQTIGLDGKKALKKYFCKICNKPITFGSKTGLCQSCSRKESYKDPRNNPQYKDGRSLIEYRCIDCNKKLSRKSKNERCRSCVNSFLYKNGGKKHPWKGKHLSKETRHKQSLAHKGENSYNWQGGITPFNQQIRKLFKYRLWRDDIFTRDDFTCQSCFKRGGYLHAHHLKSFSIILKENNINTLEEAERCQELWNINNGLTLHEKCHYGVHDEIRRTKKS